MVCWLLCVVACCLLLVGLRLVFDVGCLSSLLLYVRCLRFVFALFVNCCMMRVVRCCFVVFRCCWLSFVACCVWCVVCRSLFVVFCLLV